MCYNGRMIREIEAKTMLSHVKQPETYFGLKYGMNLYRGCQFHCIYCDSRSNCYQVANFDGDIEVKMNAIERLQDELKRKRIRGTVGTGAMNDPYMPVEKHFRLTQRAMGLFADYQFPVHIITKSDLVVRDMEILADISRVFATVSFTVTTADDALARKVEPQAPPPSARFAAMAALAKRGIITGVTMMPILPFIEDDPENLMAIIRMAKDAGATYILPAFGMTMRDGQREFFFEKLDEFFPGISQRYRREFGNDYYAPSPKYKELEEIFYGECEKVGIRTAVPRYEPRPVKEAIGQMPMF